MGLFRASIIFAHIFSFNVQSSVYVYDKATGKNIINIAGKGREWMPKAELIKPQGSNASLTNALVKMLPNVGQFYNLSVSRAGVEFQFILNVYTIPASQINETFYTNKYIYSNIVRYKAIYNIVKLKLFKRNLRIVLKFNDLDITT